MAAPYDGGCVCGAIRYRLTSEPLTLYVCHCTDCQRHFGTAFGLSMPALKSALTVLQGEPAAYDVAVDDPSPAKPDAGVTGRRRRGRFCSSCATRLWGEPSRLPEVAVLRPGTLDDSSGLYPVAHIWTRSAQPWVVIPSDTLRFKQQPPDMVALVKAWRDRAPR